MNFLAGKPNGLTAVHNQNTQYQNSFKTYQKKPHNKQANKLTKRTNERTNEPTNKTHE